MSLATLINKFISNLARILLKEKKDMKRDRQKKSENNDNSWVSLTMSDQSLLKLFKHYFQSL